MVVTVTVAVALALAVCTAVTGCRTMAVRRVMPGVMPGVTAMAWNGAWGGVCGPLVVNGAPVVGAGPHRPTTRSVAVMAVSVVLSGAAFVRWLGRRIGVLVHGGHRPIIARTTEALCSPRPS